MRILQINLDYGNKADASGVYTPPRELTENYIQYAFSKKYPDGIDGQLKSVVGRIQRKLAGAIENKKDSIELEETEYTLIKRAIEVSKFPTALCKFVMVLEEALDNTKIKEEKVSKKK